MDIMLGIVFIWTLLWLAYRLLVAKTFMFWTWRNGKIENIYKDYGREDEYR